ncbi:hypothetical protein BABINDRAFT_39139 [Babjeviella inositovora NRRL Y-12698]|uniref:Pre-mRNA-splicing factor ATP-dependent RNA helicase PRP16 n=1 Tax=Babjeviella inositovora NRRL Y-12698 TaxID=984486 RepID=A0A1E3QNA0_9ASCO|nr:uncharacterized protein BABINDRAFT_39139 [Babjeviella inositovora NRRL Y-12698]ODQ78467.1 hypothetical protein BABINDRAFT_39139 [Babjeviella inositovora NRRL Y-12698]
MAKLKQEVKLEQKLKQKIEQTLAPASTEGLHQTSQEEELDEDIENDRAWYTLDEHGYENTNYDWEDEERETEKLLESHRMHLKQKERSRARNSDRRLDNDLWERNQLQLSGTGGSRVDDIDDEEVPMQISTHHLVPPFLADEHASVDSSNKYSPVRDVESTMAIFAKRGSTLVKERRVQQERIKQAKSAASVVGTVLGEVLGIREEAAKAETTVSVDEQEVDNVSRATLKEQRRFLPAFAVRNELMQVINENQVVVVIGETGSGKTTQLSQYLLEEGYGHGDDPVKGRKKMIGCTQPRRVAAMSVAKRVSEEMEVKLGEEVGYAIRFEDCTTPRTIIKYMTYGVLLWESLADPVLEKYAVIIMDEAHERALNTDVLLGLFKSVLHKRRDLKLIITSATMNADRFSAFYNGAPQFTIPGRTYPVDLFYAKFPADDYVEAAIKQVLTIHLTTDITGDILVFMTGQEDIQATCDILAERLLLLDSPPPLEILPIYSTLPADLQAKIFRKKLRTVAGPRKVIVATNIAETSLTVDGIKYVVDTGYCKMKVYNAKMGMDTLQVVPISVANANQRSGRAGRTGPGVAYRLYTELATREEMYAQQIPEIQRTNLSSTVLLLKSLRLSQKLSEFPFMDPPPEISLNTSLYDLWCLGALDNFGELTELGTRMASFPMEPTLSKLLLISVGYQCSEEIITIVSMLSVPNVFYRPKERQAESDAIREKFFVPESDHLTLLNVYSQWKSQKHSDLWCQQHFLHLKSLRRAKDIRQQLISIMKKQKLPVVSSGTEWDTIRKCICCGFFQQAARFKKFGEFTQLRNLMGLHLHPTSALYGLGDLPGYVVYHEVMVTSKEYMNTVTAVDPLWLVEFGSVFYSLKKTKKLVEFYGQDFLDDFEGKFNMEKQMVKDKEEYWQRIKSKGAKVTGDTGSSKKTVVKAAGFRSRRGF